MINICIDGITNSTSEMALHTTRQSAQQTATTKRKHRGHGHGHGLTDTQRIRHMQRHEESMPSCALAYCAAGCVPQAAAKSRTSWWRIRALCTYYNTWRQKKSKKQQKHKQFN
jgi:hypothetical protein